MEFNHQTAEKSEPMRWGTDDQAGIGQVRSYTCAFCKRRFSNAQALGGHMNIHRRDRVKLKQQPSEENLLSLDIAVKNSTDQENQPQPQHQQPLEGKILFRLDSGEDKINTNNHKKPNCFAEINNSYHPGPQKGKIIGAKEIQLPFFAGRAAAGGNEMMKATSVMVERIEDKRIMELNHASSSSSNDELDLELRLGPEPHKRHQL